MTTTGARDAPQDGRRPGRRALRWSAFALALTVNLITLYAPRVPGPPAPGVRLDLVGHVAVFAALAAAGVLVGLALRWWVPTLVAHAALSEVVQHVALADRAGDPADLAADLAGIALGVAAGRAVVSRLMRAERPRPADGP